MQINATGSKNIIGNMIDNTNKNNATSKTFEKQLKSVLDKVNDMQVEAKDMDNKLATGEIENLHEVTIASDKADIAIQLTLTIRNKIIDAYKEIMRMQV